MAGEPGRRLARAQISQSPRSRPPTYLSGAGFGATLSERKAADRPGLLKLQGRGGAPGGSIFGDGGRHEARSCGRHGQERLPRYTSYPTAPHFSPAIGPGCYAEWLKAIPPQASTSLYLHVPFCRAMCWYCGCHTSVARREHPVAVYAAALRCEIDLVARQLDRRIRVDHVHFGGGTPTIMAPEAFADLIGSIRQSFDVAGSAEVAVEIDPRTLTSRMIDALAESGVNRASLGVQSFDPLVQRAINRVQGLDETRAAATTCGAPASAASIST